MVGRWARLPGSRDRASLKPLLMSKSIKTQQDQKPSTRHVLFWLLLSYPQGFFFFLKQLAVASSERSPQALRCLDAVTLHCDLAVPKLATRDALN